MELNGKQRFTYAEVSAAWQRRVKTVILEHNSPRALHFYGYVPDTLHPN